MKYPLTHTFNSHVYPTHDVIGFSPIGEFVLSNLFVYPLEMEPFHII